jgi:hypothetical protein
MLLNNLQREGGKQQDKREFSYNQGILGEGIYDKPRK